ncbi:MAG: glycosyltransferase family 39 protein [Acidaminococcaceae bacterium]|nr:glycosyltransferase family 39 protein [Acidaminococcaceae bacterium]
MKKQYWIVFWLAVILLLFFNNWALPITDSVESNYSQTAKEMVLSGDWVSPQIYGRYWYDKPIMSYWLIALGFKIFGFTEFGARFFPALSGVAGMALTVWGAKKLYSEKVALLSGIMLLTTIEFFAISKSILTDGMLFFFFNGALLFFYLAYSGTNKNYYYGTYVFSALATLTKGPIGFLLPGLILVLFLIWEKNWRELGKAKLISGTVLFLLVAGPWYGAMFHLHADFFGQFFGTHNFLRATVSEHPRDNVIYYYTAINILASFAWIGFLPGTIKAIIRKDGKWAMPQPREKFMLLWVFVIFFFYQNMATKYITYTYPILLPLAYLLANHVMDEKEKLNFKGVLGINIIVYGALAVTAVLLPMMAADILTNGESTMALTAVCFFLVLYASYGRIKGAPWCKTLGLIAGTTYLFIFVSIKVLAEPMMYNATAMKAAEYVNANIPKSVELYSLGDYPTSGVYYTNRTITAIVEDREENKLKPHGFSWADKNVMPMAGLSEVKGKKNIAIFMKTRNEDRLHRDLPGDWHIKNLPGVWSIVTPK